MSANNFRLHWRLSDKSLIDLRSKSGPNTEIWETPALILAQDEFLTVKNNSFFSVFYFLRSRPGLPLLLFLILKLLRGAKRLQKNSDFMNKIKERCNTTISKPSTAIKLGALFITNCSRHNHENKELEIILTIPDISRGINKIFSIS